MVRPDQERRVKHPVLGNIVQALVERTLAWLGRCRRRCASRSHSRGTRAHDGEDSMLTILWTSRSRSVECAISAWPGLPHGRNRGLIKRLVDGNERFDEQRAELIRQNLDALRSDTAQQRSNWPFRSPHRSEEHTP